MQSPHRKIAAAGGVADVDRIEQHAGADIAPLKLALQSTESIAAHPRHVDLRLVVLQACACRTVSVHALKPWRRWHPPPGAARTRRREVLPLQARADALPMSANATIIHRGQIT